MNNKGRKKNRSWLLIVILIIMAVTNPDKEDFTEHIVSQNSSGNVLEDYFTYAATELMVDTMTEENDYFIFTTFEVHDFYGNSTTYLGIFGFFIEL